MRGPYGFETSETCQTCKLRKTDFFCQLTPKGLKEFDSIQSVSAYPRGAVLFLEKQDARGVFVLCEGEIKLTISSIEGKTLILRIAKVGEILGLTAVLSGKPYEVAAETLRPCQVAFVRRDDFLHFVANNPETSQSIVRQLSSSYYGVCEQLRSVGLTASVPGRLAKLLLDWSAGAENNKPETSITLALTHGEIAEFIGSSRETVTRTLHEFKSRQFVIFKNSTMRISNRAALENFVTA
jgi:CRP/FNR family transcriptional regulator, cyclic AMP receptor protein